MNIVFFDGYCGLCNTIVDFLMRIDRSDKLKFASLQGETARQCLGESNKIVDMDTVIYFKNNKIYEKSTAILLIFSDIGGPWSLTIIFFLVPKFLRDFFYMLVAKNRYRFFKKRESCRMPSSSEIHRLLP